VIPIARAGWVANMAATAMARVIVMIECIVSYLVGIIV